MRDFKGGLGKAINKVHGRRGTFWMERYDDDALLDDAAVATKLHYLHANPVRAHLVERADEYPGASSWKAYAEDLDSLTETYFDEARWRAAGAREAHRARYTETATVKVSRPPSWAGLSPRERRAAVTACVANMRDEERAAAAEREPQHASVPPVSSTAARDPRSRPSRPKRERKRKWASGTDEQIEEFREAYRQMLPAYHTASLRFRENGTLVPFPAGTYPPRIMYAFEET